jgi:hypothetical protein
MVIENLINEHEKAVIDDSTNRLKREVEALETESAKFEQTAREHLGELWDELNPGKVEYSFPNKHRNYAVDFSIPVFFMDKWGAVKQSKDNLYDDKWGRMTIDFGHMRSSSGGSQVYEYLPAKPRELGAMFATIKERMLYKAEQDSIHRERQLERSNLSCLPPMPGAVRFLYIRSGTAPAWMALKARIRQFTPTTFTR